MSPRLACLHILAVNRYKLRFAKFVGHPRVNHVMVTVAPPESAKGLSALHHKSREKKREKTAKKLEGRFTSFDN